MRIPMKAYAARDKDGELYLYFDPPLKDKRRGQWIDKDMPILRVCELFFDEGYFDMVTWEDEQPAEVDYWPNYEDDMQYITLK